jgi:hypothetical protein
MKEPLYIVYINTMSSISSCDSYHISIDDDDDPYTKRMDELEEQYSGSDSGSNDGSDVVKNMKKELEIVSLYLKCKTGIYNLASNQYKTYSDALLIFSLLVSGSLVVFPLFSAEKISISSLGLITMFCIFLKNYYKYDISRHDYNMVSLRFNKLQASTENFLSKLVYFSNKIEKQSAFYEKMREIEAKLQDFKEESIQIPGTIISLMPVTNNMNIFSSIHDIELNQKALLSRYKNINSELKNKNKTGEKDRIRFLKENRKKIKGELNNPDYSGITDPLEKEYKLHLCK